MDARVVDTLCLLNLELDLILNSAFSIIFAVNVMSMTLMK